VSLQQFAVTTATAHLRTLAGSCSHSSTETVGSNPTGGMDVFLLWILCIVRQRSLRRTDHSSRGVLPSVVCRCVWSRNLRNGPRWVSKNYGTIYRPKFTYIKCEHRESQEPPCLRRTVISNTTQSMGVVFYPCKATWRVDISYKLFLFYFHFLFVCLTLYIVSNISSDSLSIYKFEKQKKSRHHCPYTTIDIHKIYEHNLLAPELFF
jgi:hypothetical protein